MNFGIQRMRWFVADFSLLEARCFNMYIKTIDYTRTNPKIKTNIFKHTSSFVKKYSHKKGKNTDTDTIVGCWVHNRRFRIIQLKIGHIFHLVAVE